MDYVSRIPDPPLDQFIDDIYLLSGAPHHRRLNVPPMPSAHLFLNLGPPIRVYDSNSAAPSTTFTDGRFMGMATRRFTIEYPTPTRLAGVHFKPWGMAAFVDLPLSELRDTWVPVDAIWQRCVDRLRDQLSGAGTAQATLRTLEAELRSRCNPDLRRHSALINYTAGRLESTWGTLPVHALIDSTGVSATHLASQFKGHVGITPKRLGRIYRFARLILSVDARQCVDWSALAHGPATSIRPTSQGIQGLHRPHADGLSGPPSTAPRRTGIPTGQRPHARRLIFYKRPQRTPPSIR